MTQKLIKLAFTIDKCCALSTIAKVSTYFPILMIGGRRVNAFFLCKLSKIQKAITGRPESKEQRGENSFFFVSGPDSQGRYFSQIFLGSQKYSQMAAYVCRLAISKVKKIE